MHRNIATLRPVTRKFTMVVLSLVSSFFAAVLLLGASQGTAAVHTVQPTIPDGHWVDTWAAMPQLTEPTNLPPPPFVRSNLDASS